MARKQDSSDWATPQGILKNLNQRPGGFRKATEQENAEHMYDQAMRGNPTAQNYLTRKQREAERKR